MKHADVKSTTYIDSSKENNDKDPKYKIGDIVKISRYKNIFAKAQIPNWSEEVLMVKKKKILCPGLMLLMILIEKKILGTFYKKEMEKKSVKCFKEKR